VRSQTQPYFQRFRSLLRFSRFQISFTRRACSRWLFVGETLAFGLQDEHLRALAV
jgi:hypothetical protein